MGGGELTCRGHGDAGVLQRTARFLHRQRQQFAWRVDQPLRAMCQTRSGQAIPCWRFSQRAAWQACRVVRLR